MLTKRIIACLDVHAGRVVKGVQFVDIVDAGDPAELADVFLDQAGNHAVCAPLILGHRRNPFWQARSSRCLHAIIPDRMQ